MTEECTYEHPIEVRRTGFKHTNTRAVENRTNDGKKSQLTFYSSYMEYNRLGTWQFSLSPEEAKSLAKYLNDWADRKLDGEEISEPGIWYHDSKANELKVLRFKALEGDNKNED